MTHFSLEYVLSMFLKYLAFLSLNILTKKGSYWKTNHIILFHFVLFRNCKASCVSFVFMYSDESFTAHPPLLVKF